MRSSFSELASQQLCAAAAAEARQQENRPDDPGKDQNFLNS
jgi:hypothetical protein